ncbi:IS3 family transposase [Streptomyces sp. NPDC017520]|uniref:IS3 family transposase n=1 Tax=Streptomyces sp. NPDC017520 TaxID=3364998 RepID=UPI0037ADB852
MPASEVRTPAARDDHLAAEIRRIHADSGETYGARRIHRQVRREGVAAALRYVPHGSRRPRRCT